MVEIKGSPVEIAELVVALGRVFESEKPVQIEQMAPLVNTCEATTVRLPDAVPTEKINAGALINNLFNAVKS